MRQRQAIPLHGSIEAAQVRRLALGLRDLEGFFEERELARDQEARAGRAVSPWRGNGNHLTQRKLPE